MLALSGVGFFESVHQRCRIRAELLAKMVGAAAGAAAQAVSWMQFQECHKRGHNAELVVSHCFSSQAGVALEVAAEAAKVAAETEGYDAGLTPEPWGANGENPQPLLLQSYDNLRIASVPLSSDVFLFLCHPMSQGCCSQGWSFGLRQGARQHAQPALQHLNEIGARF